MQPEYSQRPSRIYRSRSGMILGVCKGLAQYADWPVFWTRVIALVSLFVFNIWAVIVYILAGLLMKPEPVVPFRHEADQEFYDSYVNSRTMALHRLKRTFDNLDRRIRRIEDIVTARDYDWENRLNS